MVEEREKARVEYEEAVKEGRKAALGEISRKGEEVMNLRVGNVEPGGEVRLRVEYLYEMEVSLNVFWKVVVGSRVWPRYLREGWGGGAGGKGPFSATGTSLKFEPPKYTWSFKVSVSSKTPITLATSTSHKLTLIQSTPDST